ncbi:hypothetical protein BDZ91DRAFT_518819 [Kalaharituber pfeilii]|nr:hypothetical protein BDZ91DRAFT_518819 [Kalaharituber pfeilii]
MRSNVEKHNMNQITEIQSSIQGGICSLRFGDFPGVTCQQTLQHPLDEPTSEVEGNATQLVKAFIPKQMMYSGGKKASHKKQNGLSEDKVYRNQVLPDACSQTFDGALPLWYSKPTQGVVLFLQGEQEPTADVTLAGTTMDKEYHDPCYFATGEIGKYNTQIEQMFDDYRIGCKQGVDVPNQTGPGCRE